MSRNIMKNKFKVLCKDDLYSTVLVKVDYNDYHGNSVYEHHTPFGIAETIREFEMYLDLLSCKEIMEYRDYSGGNILHDMARCDKSIKYFDIVLETIGDSSFIKLLKMNDRNNSYPLSEISNLNVFKYLLSFINISGDMLYQISVNCRNKEILDYLANLINGV